MKVGKLKYLFPRNLIKEKNTLSFDIKIYDNNDSKRNLTTLTTQY